MEPKCDGDTKQHFSDVLPIAIRLLCIPRFGTADLRPKFLLPTPYALVNNSTVKLEIQTSESSACNADALLAELNLHIFLFHFLHYYYNKNFIIFQIKFNDSTRIRT